jgi:DNA-directed RNA polymerase subunit E'/Rpb7
MFECLICRPVEGQIIECIVKNITKAGIRAIYQSEEESPITIFIARDHHYNNEYFTSLKENDSITTRVIGIRFELGDENISVLSELKIPTKKTAKPKITIIE